MLKLLRTWGVNYSVAVECIPLVCTQMIGVAKYLNALFQREKVTATTNTSNRFGTGTSEFADYQRECVVVVGNVYNEEHQGR